MSEFILASGNPKKAAELSALLLDAGVGVTQAPEILEVIEDGETFRDNALLKAQAYYQKFQSPVVSDDSGLIVSSHPDILGVRSARFEPDFPDYKDKMLKLLEMMESDEGEARSAYFVCNLCFYLNPDEIFFFEGRVNGHIGLKATGDGGFGYDPLFYPLDVGGKSLAELGDWKALNSHRAKSCAEAVKFLKGYKFSIAKS